MTEGVKQHYSLKIPKGAETAPWITNVVMSTLPADRLPTSLNKPGARRLCQVKSRLPADIKLKNSKWYHKSDPYYQAEFDVQVLIGSADLKFRTLDKRGVLSQEHSAIDVDWHPTPTTAQNPAHGRTELGTNSPTVRESPNAKSGLRVFSGAGLGLGYADGHVNNRLQYS